MQTLRYDQVKVLTNASNFVFQQKDQQRWITKDYDDVWRFLHRDKSMKMSKIKRELVALCDEWKTRAPLTADELVAYGRSVDMEYDE